MRVIIFTISFPNTQSTQGAITQDSVYSYRKKEWYDGYEEWDHLALGVMIMECDLHIGSLLGVNKYEDLCLRTQEFVSKEGVCTEIKTIVQQLILPK